MMELGGAPARRDISKLPIFRLRLRFRLAAPFLLCSRAMVLFLGKDGVHMLLSRMIAPVIPCFFRNYSRQVGDSFRVARGFRWHQRSFYSLICLFSLCTWRSIRVASPGGAKFAIAIPNADAFVDPEPQSWRKPGDRSGLPHPRCIVPVRQKANIVGDLEAITCFGLSALSGKASVISKCISRAPIF